MDATDELNELKKLYLNEEEREPAPEQASPVQGEVASEAAEGLSPAPSVILSPQGEGSPAESNRAEEDGDSSSPSAPRNDSDADSDAAPAADGANEDAPAPADAPAPSVILSPQGEGSPAESSRAEEEGDSSSPSAPRNDSETADSETAPDSPAPDSPAPEKKKRRWPRFWKIYAITVAVAAMLICGLLGFFHVFLMEYEETRPLNAAKEAVAALAKGENRPGFVPSEATEFDAAADVAAIFAEAGGTANAEVVEKVGVSTEEVPVYSVREGGKEICRLRMKPGKKRRFFNTWQADGFMFGGDNAIDITVTGDTVLKLNGVEVGENYIVERDAALPGYEDFADITPKCVRYCVEGLRFKPVVTLENPYCYPNAEYKNGFWTVTYRGAEDNRQDAVNIAYSAAKAYVTYASSPNSPLAPLDKWLIPGSTLRARVLSFDRRYFTRHDSAEFRNMEDLDFSIYGADEFSIKLSFDYVMRYGKKEQTDKTVITLYMLRRNGEWKLSDVAVE
ncbi:MAG: hypothetical protein IJL83_03170 [Clostridia bacterium]|nr:hypothetical protein [Clostridia bacterium]